MDFRGQRLSPLHENSGSKCQRIDNGIDYIKDLNSNILSKMLKKKKTRQNIEKNKSWHS